MGCSRSADLGTHARQEDNCKLVWDMNEAVCKVGATTLNGGTERGVMYLYTTHFEWVPDSLGPSVTLKLDEIEEYQQSKAFVPVPKLRLRMVHGDTHDIGTLDVESRDLLRDVLQRCREEAGQDTDLLRDMLLQLCREDT